MEVERLTGATALGLLNRLLKLLLTLTDVNISPIRTKTVMTHQ